jgi:nucleoside-diphosphate-sugar epimerase
MNKPTILVTAATGHVGRPLIASLLADGVQVRALTRDPAAAHFPPQVAERFPAPVVEDLLRRWAQSVGRAADIAPDLEKLIGRQATTYAQWAAQHADAYR